MKIFDNIFKIDSMLTAWGVALGSVMSFIAPVGPFIVMTFALIVTDLYTGTRAARHRKEVIHSKGIGRSIDKMIQYLIAILLSEGFRRVFLADSSIYLVHSFPIVYIVAITISIRELKSNFENIQTVTGANIWQPIADKIGNIIDALKKK